MWFLQPLFGGFFRIAPFAQSDDDGGFFRIAPLVQTDDDGGFSALRRWRNQMMMGGMEETKTAACHARRCLQY